jgi:exosortase
MTPSKAPSSLLKGAAIMVIAGYWLVLLRHLHVEWMINPQYSYGWAVPFLCAYLFILRWPKRPQAADAPSGAWPLAWTALLALVFLPACLAEGANPDWRVASWVLSLDVIGLTLCAIWLFKGRPWVRHFAFPFAFFLVAVPWIRPIELGFVQDLAVANVNAAVELLNAIGLPAIRHGNVIEIAAGAVGVDEACSGIRSFQASLMISLFFGEFYMLAAPLRAALCFLGFTLAFMFNVFRTTLLTTVASQKGIAAIASWHDPAGVTILVACFASLWFIAIAFRRWMPDDLRPVSPPALQNAPPPSSQNASAPHLTVTGLAACLIMGVAGTEAWYRSHDAKITRPINWSVAWPTNDITFHTLPMTEVSSEMLRYDQGEMVAWTDSEGARWQGISLRWLPGRAWVQIASDHYPGNCMTATGKKLLDTSETGNLVVKGVPLQFQSFRFRDGEQVLYVFHCLWDDAAQGPVKLSSRVGYQDRLLAVRQGRRNPGQRLLELALWGPAGQAEAEALFQRQLENLIVTN